MENKEKYLPIGSIVMLEKGKKRVMITGFCLIPEGQKVIYDYAGCLYPEGMLTSSKTFLFNHDQIKEIYFMGYSDQEEVEFKQKLKETVAHLEKIESKNQQDLEMLN